MRWSFVRTLDVVGFVAVAVRDLRRFETLVPPFSSDSFFFHFHSMAWCRHCCSTGGGGALYNDEMSFFWCTRVLLLAPFPTRFQLPPSPLKRTSPVDTTDCIVRGSPLPTNKGESDEKNGMNKKKRTREAARAAPSRSMIRFWGRRRRRRRRRQRAMIGSGVVPLDASGSTKRTRLANGQRERWPVGRDPTEAAQPPNAYLCVSRTSMHFAHKYAFRAQICVSRIRLRFCWKTVDFRVGLVSVPHSGVRPVSSTALSSTDRTQLSTSPEVLASLQKGRRPCNVDVSSRGRDKSSKLTLIGFESEKVY